MHFAKSGGDTTRVGSHPPTRAMQHSLERPMQPPQSGAEGRQGSATPRPGQGQGPSGQDQQQGRRAS